MKFSIEVGAPNASAESLKNVAVLHLKIDKLEVTTFMRLAYRIFRGLAKGNGGGWLLLMEDSNAKENTSDLSNRDQRSGGDGPRPGGGSSAPLGIGLG